MLRVLQVETPLSELSQRIKNCVVADMSSFFLASLDFTWLKNATHDVLVEEHWTSLLCTTLLYAFKSYLHVPFYIVLCGFFFNILS